MTMLSISRQRGSADRFDGPLSAPNLAAALVLILIINVALPPLSWTQGWRPSGLTQESVSAIAVDPREPDVIYVGSESDFSAGTMLIAA